MNRREILKLAFLSSGVAISPPFATAFLSGCAPEKSTSSSQLFDSDRHALLVDVMDTILPKTDSPSASEVGVDKVLEDFVLNVYSQEDSDKSKKELTELLDFLGQDFSKLSVSGKESALLELGASKDPKNSGQRDAYKQLRQQTIALYLLTQPVMTEHLDYLPVPGSYEACIDIDPSTTKAWAI